MMEMMINEWVQEKNVTMMRGEVKILLTGEGVYACLPTKMLNPSPKRLNLGLSILQSTTLRIK